MEHREPDIDISLDRALIELKEHPDRSVRARLRGMEIEMRIVQSPSSKKGLGDVLAALGPWEGETEEELSQLLNQARNAGSDADPPVL